MGTTTMSTTTMNTTTMSKTTIKTVKGAGRQGGAVHEAGVPKP